MPLSVKADGKAFESRKARRPASCLKTILCFRAKGRDDIYYLLFLFSGSSHLKIKNKKRIFAVTALLIGSQLSAQDTTVLENLVVSANKYSTKTTETGKVVVVITRKDIEKAGSRDLSQLITELGGVFINGYTNNPGKE